MEVEQFDTNRPIGTWSGGSYFEIIPREFLTSAGGRSGKVGAASSYLFDAAPLNRFAIAWLERNAECGMRRT